MSPSSFAACDAAALENRLLSVDWQMLSQGRKQGLPQAPFEVDTKLVMQKRSVIP